MEIAKAHRDTLHVALTTAWIGVLVQTRTVPLTDECVAPSTNASATSVRLSGRRVGRHHLAFIRGYFEGIDIVVLAERYLDTGRDKRKARDARRWILDELTAAARQRGDVSAVRLLRLPAGTLPEGTPGGAPLSLESFREEVDPEGVYTEAELGAFYQEACLRAAASRRRVRDARLRRRQRLLLDTLEAALVEPPRPEHRIGDWLDPAIAARLEAAGLETIERLVRHINRYGYRWYRRVPRVGEEAARRVRDWLQRHAGDTGLRIVAHSESPRNAWSPALRDAHRSAATEMAPMEWFHPPHAQARADRDALLRVLSAHAGRPATYRAYRLQAERLLLWTWLVRAVPLRQLQASDAALFLRFAAAPTPAQQWCGPKAERGTAQWRPFERAMPAAGLALAKRVLSSVCAGLMKDGYLSTNPFRPLVPPPLAAGPGESSAPRPRASPGDLPRLDDLCASPGGDARSLRMRAVFSLLRDTGLPLQGLTRLRVASLANWPRRAATTTEASMAGAAMPAQTHAVRDVARAMPAAVVTGISISDGTMAALEAYFEARRIDPTRSCNRDMPLIGRHVASGSTAETDRTPLTPNVLARAIAAFLARDGTGVDGDAVPGRGASAVVLPPVATFRDLRRQARERLDRDRRA